MDEGIDGQTRLVGLIGWPTAHSLSPAMHNAAFAASGLNWRCVPLPVLAGQLEAAVRGLAALGFRGASVTAPYKQRVLPFVDRVDPKACAIGAVNTLVVCQDGMSVCGYNTDEMGFINALRCSGASPQGCRALIVGAGGAARAVAFGLLWAGADEIVVLSRTPRQGEEMVADLAAHATHEVRLAAFPLTTATLVKAAFQATLLVNATPLGTWPETGNSLWPDDVALPAHLLVFDLVYNPRRTRLLEQANASGARALDGLEMLVQQGATAFALWTGKPAPVAVMRAACIRMLGEV